MVERCEKIATFLKPTHAIEAHGIKPLKDVLILAMLRRASVLFDEALDFLEPGDEPPTCGTTRSRVTSG
jgi:hypothetical protein